MSDQISEQQHWLLKSLARFPDGATRAQLRSPATQVVNSLLGRLILEQKAPKGRSKLLKLTDVGREWIAQHPEFVKVKLPYSDSLRLFMLELMLVGGSATSTKFEKKPTAKELKSLIDAKLLESSPAPKRVTQFTLTDAGWKWVEDHLAEPFDKSGPAGRLLGTTLAALQAFLAGRSLRLAAFVSSRPRPEEGGSAGEVDHPTSKDGHADRNGRSQDIEAAIRTACLELGSGKDRQGLRLAEVRAKLGRFNRADQDRALLDLARARRLVMYGMDDPQEIKAEDRAAELRTPGGEPRHIVYWIGN